MALTLEEMVAKRRADKKIVSAPAGVDRRKAIMDRMNAEVVTPAPPAAPVSAAPAPPPPPPPASSLGELATLARTATQPQSRRDLESQWPTSPPKPVIAPAGPAISPADASTPVIPSMPSDVTKVNPLLQGGESGAAPSAPPAVAVNPILEPEKIGPSALPQEQSPADVAYGPEGERMRAGIDRIIDDADSDGRMGETERRALLLTGGAASKARGALGLVGKIGNVFESEDPKQEGDSIRAKTLKDSLLAPFRRLRAQTDEPWQIEIDRAKAIHQTVQDSMAKFGVPGAFAAQFGIMGYELAVNIAMMKTFAGTSPFGTGGAAPAAGKGVMAAWAARAAKEAPHVAKMFMWTYSTTPGTHEERMRSAKITALYRATPMLSMGMPSNFTAMAVDTALNQIISLNVNPVYAELRDDAKEAAKERGIDWDKASNVQRAQILRETMTWQQATDVAFDVFTNVLFAQSTKSATKAELQSFVGEYGKTAEAYAKHLQSRGVNVDATHLTARGMEQAAWLPEMQKEIIGAQGALPASPRPATPQNGVFSETGLRQVRDRADDQADLDSSRRSAEGALAAPRSETPVSPEARAAMAGAAARGEVLAVPARPTRVNPILEPDKVPVPEAKPEPTVSAPAPQAKPEAGAPPERAAENERQIEFLESTSGVKFRAEQVPVERIKLSEDAMQFKEGGNPLTGETEPLGGKYDPFGSAAIVVWERLNGDLEVVTGRHRLALARRSGTKTISTHIAKEADGFNRDMAITLDAEMNIRDGNGKVSDYALYFKNSGITEAEADAGGLLSRDKGRQGFDIGKKASPDLYAAFRAGNISEQKAAAIASLAPDNPEAQALGMAYASKNPANKTAEYMRAIVSMAPKSDGRQLNLLGWDDSWQIEADKMAKAATSTVREIATERNALDAARKLTGDAQRKAVEKFGFKAGDKDALIVRIQELNAELARYDNWHLDSELTAGIREKAGLPPADKPADSFKLESASKAQLDAEAKRLADKAKLDDMATAPLEGKPDADIGQARIPGTGGEIDLFNAPKTAQEPARAVKTAQEPAPEKPTTPLAKLVADTPQAFRVTSSRGNVHNVKMPDGTTYPIRAESKAEAIAKAQELASRTPEDVIDDSIRMVEEAKAQAEKDAKGGYVSTGAAAPVARVLRRAMEGFFGHMRAFGEQYVSDKPLMRRLEQAYHERAAAVESGIADIRKILVEAGPRRLEDGVAVAIAIEEGVARDALPPPARRLYDLSKQTMDAITDLEKAEGVLKKGFPEGTRDAINEKIAEIQAKQKMNKADMENVSKLQEELAVLDKFAAYLPHGIVARRVMKKIFEEGNGRARRDLGDRLEQFHHQRKGRGTMREYLEAKVIRPEDMDIGKLMMDSAVSAYQKISMKALMDYGIENKYIRFNKEVPGDPKEWFEMPQLAKPAQVFKVSPPEGQKVWVQRLFGLGLEELSGAQNKPTTAFDKILSIVKVCQFYNPKIIWSYNLQQRIYGGAIEWNPVKDTINTKDAWRAVLTDNEDYKQANRLGIFQVPDNLPRATVDSQIDIATRSMRTDLSRGGVIGNQLVKVLERATGEKIDPQAWKDKNLRAALDAIMLPLRGISTATWMGDKVQRMHTFYNLTRRGMSPQDAAEQTARMHGAYSKIGKEYKAWARRVFFVHSFRLLMPIQTMRAYTTPIKIAIKALTGKEIPQGEARRAIMALAGTVLFPTLIDSALRYNGWTPTEEEEEFFKKGPMQYLRIPVGNDGYRVTLALPNWKYKKTFMYDGEEREVVLGVNNIANMATKWIMRASPKGNIVSPTTKDLPIMTLLKWEVNPLYRIGMDIFENNSSFGTTPPRGSAGDEWDSAVGYLFGNIWRIYGDAYRLTSDDRESDVYKERQRAEMIEAMNFGDRVLQNVFGYAYTRAAPEKRVGFMINALRRSAGSARSTAEIHYKGETLEEKVAEIDILEAKMERALRRRYNIPRPPVEIVRIITDPGIAKNPAKQKNAARVAKYGMDGTTAKDLRKALRQEARDQGWDIAEYDSKWNRTQYGLRLSRLRRFIKENNIE